MSSKTLAFVKLRMEKLSSHFSGQGSLLPSASVVNTNLTGEHSLI